MLDRRSLSTIASAFKILGIVVAFSVASLASERLPFRKSNTEVKIPLPPPKEVVGYDEAGNAIWWDPQPRVTPIGDGKYEYKWLGKSGKELTLVYQRPDVVDVVAEGAANPSEGGEIRYEYTVLNLGSSKQNLGGFEVHVFSSDTRVEKDPSVFAVNPAQLLTKEFPEGVWIRFAPVRGRRVIGPGQEAVLRLTSPDMPGLVECRAHADTISVKVKEESPPQGFLELFLGRDAWPHGYTIGPDERLGKMGPQGRLNYLIIRLSQMLELGWIENEKVMQWYKENLKPAKAAEVRARAKSDFDKKLITSEVLALMTYLTK